jgi:xanthine dehydrogenase accessory factor
MREELEVLRRWQDGGTRFALATVTATSRSAPRGAGATMAVHPDGQVVGSVSGGCVEGALVEVAEGVLATGEPQRVTYGISDDEAMAVGLTCGGTIEVFVRPCTQETIDLDLVAEAIREDRPIAIVTVIDHATRAELVGQSLMVTDDEVRGGLDDEALEVAIVDAARQALTWGEVRLLHLGPAGERRGDDVAVLVEAFAPRPRLLVFGAIDFAGAVASIGSFLGYHVTVCDARARFATAARFPDADEVVVDWPHRYLASTHVDERTAMCVLTHDPKFDVPVLKQALQTDAGYIGVMGSRRTHTDRLERLRDEGVTEEQLTRLHSPIGLDLGGKTPQETAVAIAAELILTQRGGSGVALRETDGPIHREPAALPR